MCTLNCTIGDSHFSYPNHIGAFGKNKTSENGKLLVDLLTQNNLYACNTQFKHKLAHVTTFNSNLKIKSRNNPIRKQIDFLLAHNSWKKLNTDCISYSGTLCTSDHRLVKKEFTIDWRKFFEKPSKNKNIKVEHLKIKKLQMCTEKR